MPQTPVSLSLNYFPKARGQGPGMMPEVIGPSLTPLKSSAPADLKPVSPQPLPLNPSLFPSPEHWLSSHHLPPAAGTARGHHPHGAGFPGEQEEH